MEGDRVVVQDHTVPCTISIHSLRMEGDSVYGTCFKLSRYFNPLPPHGGRRGGQTKTVRREGISIHSLRMEGDILPAVVAVPEDSSFQSTPSAWRETFNIRDICKCIAFQSTPSAWRETMCGLFVPREIISISIHSLRMEGDRFSSLVFGGVIYFNPLPPHGGRLRKFRNLLSPVAFQSTPSAWRETIRPMPSVRRSVFQSTPSAWRETSPLDCSVATGIFQSTPSAWRET